MVRVFTGQGVLEYKGEAVLGLGYLRVKVF